MALERATERKMLRAIWYHMHRPCSDPRAVNWKYYGGRGIKVSARWNDFETFLADMSPRPEGYTLHRIDNNGGYSPGNCRWATRSEQQGGMGYERTGKVPVDALARKLIECRADYDLTLAFVGEQIGITKAAVANIERGISQGRRTTRLRLIRFLRERGYEVQEGTA